VTITKVEVGGKEGKKVKIDQIRKSSERAGMQSLISVWMLQSS
jgi:hypothetical protein